jgi:hypothetical protein
MSVCYKGSLDAHCPWNSFIIIIIIVIIIIIIIIIMGVGTL